MRQSIDRFKSEVIDRGALARPNLFRVNIDFPNQVKRVRAGQGLQSGGYANGVTKLAEFTVRAAQLPSTNMGVVEVPYRGRTLKIAGDRSFEPWTITVLNDQDMDLRSAFEIWISMMQDPDTNYSRLGIRDGVDSVYKNMSVEQLSRTKGNDDGAKTIKKYEFQHCYPSSISSIDLDWGSNDAIQEFTVEMQIVYWNRKNR